MRHQLLIFLSMIFLALTACEETSPRQNEPDRDSIRQINPTLQVDAFESEEMTVYLSVETDSTQIEELIGQVARVAPTATVEFDAGPLDVAVAEGAGSVLDECLLWEAPSLRMTGIPDPVVAATVVEAMESSGLITYVTYPPLGLFLDLETLGDEAMNIIELCDSRRVTVLFNTEGPFEWPSLRDRALTVPGVVGAAIEREAERVFIPDLSDYGELALCYQPVFDSLTVFVESDEAKIKDAVVTAFQAADGVAGFLGWGIDESLDPILAWERAMFEGDDDFYFETCAGIEAYVNLDGDISDADAGLVAARALAVAGVADVQLWLPDPTEFVECESTGGGPILVATGDFITDTIVDSCLVPPSVLTVYRGDKTLASREALADALCELDGVLSIATEAHEREPSPDPYETCGVLYIEAYLEKGLGDSAIDAIRTRIGDLEEVARVDGPYVGDYLEETVEVGSLDESLCLSTGTSYGLTLKRMTREDVESLAAEITSIRGIAGVTGTALGIFGRDPEVCGHEVITVVLDPEAGESARKALLDLFEARSDVVAVVLQRDPEGNANDTLVVRFDRHSPEGLDDLGSLLGSMAGVEYVDVDGGAQDH